MTTFSFGLSATIRSYLTLKRALGRQSAAEEWVLAHLDRFLAARRVDLIAETFAAWCLTLRAWNPQRVADLLHRLRVGFHAVSGFGASPASCRAASSMSADARIGWYPVCSTATLMCRSRRVALAARGRRRVLLPRFAPSRGDPRMFAICPVSTSVVAVRLLAFEVRDHG